MGFPGATKSHLPHTPSGRDPTAQNPWMMLISYKIKQEINNNGYCLPIAAVLGNSSFPGIVLGGAESNRAVCWSSWEATTRSRSCKKEILMLVDYGYTKIWSYRWPLDQFCNKFIMMAMCVKLLSQFRGSWPMHSDQKSEWNLENCWG